MKRNQLRFDVGGKKFKTTAVTLAIAGPNSFFGPLLSNNWNINTNVDDDDDELVFIDRNPDCFAVILDLLRTGELSIPPHVSKDSLIREAQFYGVLELVRAASWATPLNGDLLLPSSSLTCRVHYSLSAKRILGSPNGGFCVRNDTSVHVYDWMLHEHPPIHLDNNYGKVNDTLWVGTNNIAISTANTVGMFDAVTGKLQYKFVDQKGNQVRGATSMCLSDSNIFHLYQNDNTAIGMLDCESGKSTGTLYLHFPTHNLSGLAYNQEIVWRPINLQSLNGSSNCLLAMHAIFKPGHYMGEYIETQIIDTRDRHSVYNRSCTSKNYNPNTNCRMMIQGVTLMEDRNSICLISRDCDIGFLDLRFTGDVQWRSTVNGCTSRKVMYHNDRIFMLSSDHLLAHSVSDLAITSNIIPRNGGGGNSRFEVTDFSISGDRLFTLQSITNLVDVWETPRPSCLSYI